MRFPLTINKNCLAAYTPDQKYARKWRKKSIRSYSIESWDAAFPKSLQVLCIECIAKNWCEFVIIDEIILPEDRFLLLELLPEDLPLELTLPKIHDEIYWKKCYIKRWPKNLPQNCDNVQMTYTIKNTVNKVNIKFLEESLKNNNKTDINQTKNGQTYSNRSSRTPSIKSGQSVDPNKRTWKKSYCEMHVKDYLENLKPEDYNPEKIKALCDLCGSYIEILKIQEMICMENSSNKIPLNAIITGFPNLRELCLTFKQTYAIEEFSWDIVNVSYQDIHLFAKGLDWIRLRTLRITNSDIDCEKAIIILKALSKHCLEILDFSHCKIGDIGLIGISQFILENALSLKELYLNNNRIGAQGIKSLAYSVSQESCNILVLNLRLNQFYDEAGNMLINSIVKFNRSIRTLCLSGCGLDGEFEIAKALRTLNYLENLDISNNVLRDKIGQDLLETVKVNATLKNLDLRMCKIPSDIEAQIQDEIYKNRKGLKRSLWDDDIDDLVWDDNLILQMNEIFLCSEPECESPEVECDEDAVSDSKN